MKDGVQRCEGGSARGSVRMHIISLQQRSLMQGVAGGLRAEFATVLRMPVPDRLATLMRRLDSDLGPSARRGRVHAQSRALRVDPPPFCGLDLAHSSTARPSAGRNTGLCRQTGTAMPRRWVRDPFTIFSGGR